MNLFNKLAEEKTEQLSEQMNIVNDLDKLRVTCPCGVMNFFKVERQMSLRHIEQMKRAGITGVFGEFKNCMDEQSALYKKTSEILKNNIDVCNRLNDLK